MLEVDKMTFTKLLYLNWNLRSEYGTNSIATKDKIPLQSITNKVAVL